MNRTTHNEQREYIYDIEMIIDVSERWNISLSDSENFLLRYGYLDEEMNMKKYERITWNDEKISELESEIIRQIEAIRNDVRFRYDREDIRINAPLALEQLSMDSKLQILERIKNRLEEAKTYDTI